MGGIQVIFDFECLNDAFIKRYTPNILREHVNAVLSFMYDKITSLTFSIIQIISSLLPYTLTF